MRKNSKHPIRKCGKCPLNFKTYCGVFENPHETWNSHRKCPGFMNKKMHEKYLKQLAKASQQVRSNPSRFARQQQAKLRRTATHRDDTHLIRPTEFH